MRAPTLCPPPMHVAPSRPSLPAQAGMTLVLVLVLLVVLGWGAAASVQSAITSERMHTNSQQTAQAQQQAELALQRCEAELLKADASRVWALQEQQIVTTAYRAAPAWAQRASWRGALATAQGDCMVERQVLADDQSVYVVTARGHGPQALVWLQSHLVLGSP